VDTLVLPGLLSCGRILHNVKRLTSELTRRRDFNQESPDELSYETRSRRSRPTICSAVQMASASHVQRKNPNDRGARVNTHSLPDKVAPSSQRPRNLPLHVSY
jgi:hypothetical protein